MFQYWLLTSTFYGNWLPGDPRGFVSRVLDFRPEDGPPVTRRLAHNTPGSQYDRDFSGLHRAAHERLKSDPVCIEAHHAKVLCTQFQETATYRQWQLLALAVMFNHIHLVAGGPDDPHPTKLLGDFKAYGSRALNRQFGKRENWWTYDGSKRKLPNERAVRDAVIYVARDQPSPLVVWVNPLYATLEALQEEYEARKRAREQASSIS